MVRFNRTSFKNSRSSLAWMNGTSLNQQARPRAQPAELKSSLRSRARKIASWPVSRVLYGPRPLRRENVAAIHLGRMLPCASRNLPGRWAGNSPRGFPLAPPLFGLAPGGVYRAAPVASRAVGSYPTLSPLPRIRQSRTVAVCFLWHFPWGRPRRPLTGTVFPWSPDFPHPRPFGVCGCGRPASWQGV